MNEVEIEDTWETSKILGSNLTMYFNENFDFSELSKNRDVMKNQGQKRLQELYNKLKPMYQEFQSIKPKGEPKERFKKRKEDLNARMELLKSLVDITGEGFASSIKSLLGPYGIPDPYKIKNL